MKDVVIANWDAVMDNQRNPLRHMSLEAQHYCMQVLGWMWSMVFSLSFLSIFQFGYVWAAHLFVTAGICMTIALFKQAEKEAVPAPQVSKDLSASSRCVWKLDSEA
jgi:hypothetical protein